MRVGIDLGGTKIEAVALDNAGAVQCSRRLAAPASYPELIAAMVAIVAEVEGEVGAAQSIGIGTPGAHSRTTGLMKNADNTAMNGRPLVADLERALRRPIRIANDAHCFALSEATDGAAAGADVVFGVIVGTGCGGGIVIRGKALTGVNAISGEWGHNPLPWPTAAEVPGPTCGCGRSGCIEAYLSGPGLSRDHRLVAGAELSAQRVAERAAAGDPDCGATLHRYADRMARALASVINVLDPDVIVVGGGVSHIAALYELVPRLWAQYIFSDAVETRLVRNAYGDASGVRGAAWLWD